MQRKHLTWLGSGFTSVHAEQVHAPPRLEPELDAQEMMLPARDRPDRGLDPSEVMELVRLLAGVARPSFWRR